MMANAIPASVVEFRQNYRANEFLSYSSEVVHFLFTSVLRWPASSKPRSQGLFPISPLLQRREKLLDYLHILVYQDSVIYLAR